jgi:hypothetical protein
LLTAQLADERGDQAEGHASIMPSRRRPGITGLD